MSAEPQIVIVADDLTGAADAAASLARHGLVTLISLGGGSVPEADALVFSTESRHVPEAEAVELVRRNARHIQQATWYYKKIDSTLRGHPAPELITLMEVLGMKGALIAPAFPAQGRTTVAGRQLLDGVPIEETHFGPEVQDSGLVALFAQRGLPVQHIDLAEVRSGALAIGEDLTVVDAETGADLAVLAEAARDSSVRLLCGSAGLMAGLSDTVQWKRTAPEPELPVAPAGPALVVAGSRNPSTERQVQFAKERGAALLPVDPASLHGFAAAAPTVVERACNELTQGRDTIITTAGSADSSLPGPEIAGLLTAMIAPIIDSAPVGSLVLTGGDIAQAACSMLRASAIWLLGEVEPGAPHGRLIEGDSPGLPVVTKAGGFGDDSALSTAMQYHKSQA